MGIELENQFILVTYQSGALTKAAQVLGVSQPALSMRISKVEEKLGFAIFNRKVTPIELTKEGSLYLEYLKQQEILIRDYTRRLEELEDSENRQLAIGGPAVYMETIIADNIAKLHKRYPKCNVQIKNASLPELIHQANEGLIDCFISTSDDLPENFETVKVKKERLYLCIPADWEVNEQIKEYQILPGSGGECFDYHKLDGMDFISMEESQPLQKELRRFFKNYRIQPHNSVQVNQVTTGIKLASLGEGIFLACEDAISNCRNSEKIAVYPLPDDFSGRQIYVAYHKSHYLSKACQELIGFLQEMNEKGLN